MSVTRELSGPLALVFVDAAKDSAGPAVDTARP